MILNSGKNLSLVKYQNLQILESQILNLPYLLITLHLYLMYYPKITIITPSFNQGQFIEKTILSVLDQKYPNLEYIIIDGGSTDNTIDIIKQYEKYFTFWISEKDNGQSHALNKGFAKATGDIVGWINSDDHYENNTFEIVRKSFFNTSISVIAGNCRMIYDQAPEKDFIDRPGEITFQRLTRYWEPFFCPPQPSIFFRKQVITKVGYIDESLIYGLDLDLWLRISKKFEFHYINELLSNYLIHDTSKSGTGNGFEKFIPEWKKVVSKHIANASFFEKIKYWRALKKYKNLLPV